MFNVRKILREYLIESSGSKIKLQRGQFGDVSDGWDFNISDGQHGKGIYCFRYGDKKMIEYYSKMGEKIHTFIIDSKYFIDLSNKNLDYWGARTFMYNNPQYKAFMFKHKGYGVPTSKEIIITDPNIINVI